MKKNIDLKKYYHEKPISTFVVEKPLPLPGANQKMNAGSVFPRTSDALAALADYKNDPHVMVGGLDEISMSAYLNLANMMGALVANTKGAVIENSRIQSLSKDALYAAEFLHGLLKGRNNE